MKNLNYLFFGAFALMVAAQLFVPASMVWESESIISEGKVFRFKTVPVDPNDPFRGKYVRLSFEESTINQSDAAFSEVGHNQKVFALLAEDEEGFAKVVELAEHAPESGYFIPLKASNQSWFGNNRRVTLQFPFNRFYMEESKAPIAEKIYRQASLDSTTQTWAVVYVKEGKYVLQDVMINGRSLKELVEEELK